MKIEPFTTSCTTDTTKSYEFKYDDSKSYHDNINDYKNKLDDFSRSKFEVNRQKSYKLTYMTCIIYSIIAFGIIFIAALTDWGNNLFYNELYLFTMTFIVGSILIISLLVYKVYSFDFPDLTKKITNDAYYCPDYWISKTINPSGEYDEVTGESEEQVTNKFFGENNYSHFNIECSLSGIYNMNMLFDNDVLNNHYGYKKGTVNGKEVLFIELHLNNDQEMNTLKTRCGLIQDNEYFKFCQMAATMSGYTLQETGRRDNPYQIIKNNVNALTSNGSSYDNIISTNIIVPLICSRIYPLFMAHEDVKHANENRSYSTTKFRCAFSKLTGIPWSQIGCE
jgi:hypothetical protein